MCQIWFKLFERFLLRFLEITTSHLLRLQTMGISYTRRYYASHSCYICRNTNFVWHNMHNMPDVQWQAVWHGLPHFLNFIRSESEAISIKNMKNFIGSLFYWNTSSLKIVWVKDAKCLRRLARAIVVNGSDDGCQWYEVGTTYRWIAIRLRRQRWHWTRNVEYSEYCSSFMPMFFFVFFRRQTHQSRQASNWSSTGCQRGMRANWSGEASVFSLAHSLSQFWRWHENRLSGHFTKN